MGPHDRDDSKSRIPSACLLPIHISLLDYRAAIASVIASLSSPLKIAYPHCAIAPHKQHAAAQSVCSVQLTNLVLISFASYYHSHNT